MGSYISPQAVLSGLLRKHPDRVAAAPPRLVVVYDRQVFSLLQHRLDTTPLPGWIYADRQARNLHLSRAVPDVALLHPEIGAPLIGYLLEFLAACGVGEALLVTSAGALNPELGLGDVFMIDRAASADVALPPEPGAAAENLLVNPRPSEQVPGRVLGKAAGALDSGAIGGDENAAGRRPQGPQPGHGGLPTGSEATADPDVSQRLARAGASVGAAPRRVKALSTDRFFRTSRIDWAPGADSGDVLEMEAATAFAVAADCGVRAGAIGYVTDVLSGAWERHPTSYYPPGRTRLAEIVAAFVEAGQADLEDPPTPDPAAGHALPDRRPRPTVVLVNSGKREPIAPLEEDPRHRLLVITEEQYRHRYSPSTPVGVVADLRDVRAVVGATMLLTDGEPPQAVIAPSERSQVPAAHLRAVWRLPGMSLSTATAVTDKHEMKRRLRASGVPVAPSRLIATGGEVVEAGDALGWPVLVKPVDGTGSMGMIRLDDPAQAAAWACEADGSDGPRLVERWLDVDVEYHCDGVVSEGVVRHATASRYLDPLLGVLRAVNGSYTLPPEHPRRDEVCRLHAEVVRVLGIESGVTHLELLEVDGRLLVGEIAGRPAGGGIPDMVLRHTGIDLWVAFLDLCVGRTPALEPVEQAGIGLNCQLPVRHGRVRAVPDWAEVGRVPGVVRVDPAIHVGDVVAGAIHSSRAAAQVQLRLADESEVHAAVRALSGFTIEVDEG